MPYCHCIGALAVENPAQRVVGVRVIRSHFSGLLGVLERLIRILTGGEDQVSQVVKRYRILRVSLYRFSVMAQRQLVLSICLFDNTEPEARRRLFPNR